MERVILTLALGAILIAAVGCDEDSSEKNSVSPPIQEPDTVIFIEEPPYRVEQCDTLFTPMQGNNYLRTLVVLGTDTVFAEECEICAGIYPEVTAYFPLFEFEYSLDTYQYSYILDNPNKTIILSQKTVAIATRGNVGTSAQLFFNRHYSVEDYLAKEYENARDQSEDAYWHSRSEWNDEDFKTKLLYLSAPFNNHPLPPLSDERFTDYKYWLVLKHPEQYGFGWPDQRGDDPETPEWDGTSNLYNDYKAFFE